MYEFETIPIKIDKENVETKKKNFAFSISKNPYQILLSVEF